MTNALWITHEGVRLNVDLHGAGLEVGALPTCPSVYAEVHRPSGGVRIGETGNSIRGKIRHDIAWFRSMHLGTAPVAQLRRQHPIALAARKSGAEGFAYFVVGDDPGLADKALRQSSERRVFNWVRAHPDWVDWNRQRSWRRNVSTTLRRLVFEIKLGFPRCSWAG
jgi:hypothetical protein